MSDTAKPPVQRDANGRIVGGALNPGGSTAGAEGIRQAH